MQLAPLQILAPVVAVGATTWGLGAALSDGRGARRRSIGTALVLGSAVVGLVYGLFLGVGAAMEEDPGLAVVGAVGVLGGVGLVGLLLASRRRSRPQPAEEPGDDEGGGGLRCVPLTPPRPPAPASGGGPELPSAPWDQFDDLRTQWERVPAGTR